MSQMKTDRKPPLAKSPIRLRPRRVLESNTNYVQISTGGSLIRKPEKARRSGVWEMEETELRPEYQSVSWEMRALAKMVGDELGKDDVVDSHSGFDGNFSMSTNSSPLFERGRFYEEYSARRNERLNRKNKNKGCETNSTAAVFASASATKYSKYSDKLGVTVESAKRSTCTRSTLSSSTRKLQSLRKSVSAAYSSSVETLTPAPPPITNPSQTPRYMLRSLTTKENKKPPLPQAFNSHKSAISGGRRIGPPTATPRVGY